MNESFLFRLVYRVWSYFRNVVVNNMALWDRVYYFYNPDLLNHRFRYSSIACYYKALVLLFLEIEGESLFHWNFIEPIKAYWIRLYRYPTIHRLFAYERYCSLIRKGTKETLSAYAYYCSLQRDYRRYSFDRNLPIPEEFSTAFKLNNLILASRVQQVYNLALIHKYTWSERYAFVKIPHPIAKMWVYINVHGYTYTAPALCLTNTISGFFSLLGREDSWTFYRRQRIPHRYLKHAQPDIVRLNNLTLVNTDYLKMLQRYQRFYLKYLEPKELKLHSMYYMYSVLNKRAKKIVEVVPSFERKLRELYAIKYNPTDVTKNLSLKRFKKYRILFLRKNKIFNKGRYSRNRQLYRTGVYWCLWVNIIFVFGLYLYFYRFTFNFGYVWWVMFMFIASIFGGRIVKYRFYNPQAVVREFLKYRPLFVQIVTFVHEHIIKGGYALAVKTVRLAYIGFKWWWDGPK